MLVKVPAKIKLFRQHKWGLVLILNQITNVPHPLTVHKMALFRLWGEFLYEKDPYKTKKLI